MKKLILSVVIALLLSGCSTMTIHPKERIKIASPPSYTDTIPFYFWGIKGEKRLDVKQICGSKKPVQMQTQTTLENGLFTVLTFGIYAPHTAKVWCR